MLSSGNHENGHGQRLCTYCSISNGEPKEQNKWLPKRIILVRHGESLGNADLEVYATTPNHKIKLTPKGIGQAKESGELIKKLVSEDDETSNWKVVFYVSPTTRTLETFREIARLFPKRRVVGVKEEYVLREQHFGNLNDPPSIAKIKDERTNYGRFFYRVPGGEAGCEVYDRISRFVDSLRSDIDARRFSPDPTEALNLVIVSHGFTCRVFLMKWFQWTIDQFENLNRMKSSEFQIMQLGKGGDYSLAIHHDDKKLLEWGLSPEMIEDQKRRAYGIRDGWGEKWDTHRFLDHFGDSDDSEEDDIAKPNGTIGLDK